MNVKEFAINNGYIDIRYERVWHEYNVYEPILESVHMKTGYPLRILERNGKIRFTTPDESIQYLREHF